jgi:hypothetical protein
VSRLSWTRSWLALLLASAACGDVHVIGRECPAAGCTVTVATLPDCGVRLSMPIVEVAAGGEIDRCQLFTLDGLTGAGPADHVYVSSAAPNPQPAAGHHLEVRIAPNVPDFVDGPVDCMQLWSRAIAWVPLMATQENDPWGFADAPLVTARNHRLLIDDHFTNQAPQPVAIDVTLDIRCTPKVPSHVSQAFEFSDRKPQLVVPGDMKTAGSICPFEKEVMVSRFYRWTHLTTSYSVWLQKEAEPFWHSSSAWILNLSPPLHFMAGDDVRWQCEYDNVGDKSFEIGGNSPDSCSLLGIYQLVSGGEDDSPERCIR